MISNTFQIELEVTKIAVLIDQYLYVYTYNNLNNSYKKKTIKIILDDEYNTSPFNIKIDKDKLTIYYIQTVKLCRWCQLTNFIKIYFLENYSSTSRSFNKIKEYNTGFSYNPEICQFDYYNSLIKCIYKEVVTSSLKYLVIKEDTTLVYDNNFETLEDFDIFPTSFTFAFSNDMTFFCYLKGRKKEIACYFNRNSDNLLQKVEKNFDSDSCDELMAYYFFETKHFILYCKKNYYYYSSHVIYIIINFFIFIIFIKIVKNYCF